MPNAPFKIGDVVELQTGGTKMTVEFVRTDGLIECAWFDGATLSRDTFYPDALRKAFVETSR